MDKMKQLRKYPPRFTKNGNRVDMSVFICDFCNKEVIKQTSSGKKHKSCGCMHNKHGHMMTGTRLYKLWSGINQRCNNKYSRNYHNYGGRGIKICKEWNDSKNFIRWAMSNGYTDDLQIDRIDNDGDYFPENCRFTTQTINKRKNRRVVLSWVIVDAIRDFNSILSLRNIEISKLLGLHPATVSDVIFNRTWVYKAEDFR